jgi:hypothetical protein
LFTSNLAKVALYTLFGIVSKKPWICPSDRSEETRLMLRSFTPLRFVQDDKKNVPVYDANPSATVPIASKAKQSLLKSLLFLAHCVSPTCFFSGNESFRGFAIGTFFWVFFIDSLFPSLFRVPCWPVFRIFFLLQEAVLMRMFLNSFRKRQIF